MFWNRSHVWGDIRSGHKGKGQKAVDTTGRLDTVLVKTTNSLGKKPNNNHLHQSERKGRRPNPIGNRPKY